jgi:CheY-like chemotaxis protein
LPASDRRPDHCLVIAIRWELKMASTSVTAAFAAVLLRTEGRRVPAIVMTAFDQHGMREKCLKAGTTAYLVKPLERADVASAIEETTAATI